MGGEPCMRGMACHAGQGRAVHLYTDTLTHAYSSPLLSSPLSHPRTHAHTHFRIILGIGVPVVVVLRFPALIALAFTSVLRFHKMIEFVFLNTLIALKVTGVGKDLWRKVVAMARRRSDARRVQRRK